MCGFAGFLTSGTSFQDADAKRVLRQMADSISHRGPDSDGYWVDDSAGIGLAHRRLAIVDLSPAGDQPMTSGSDGPPSSCAPSRSSSGIAS